MARRPAVVGAAEGTQYDWTNDHVLVKVTSDDSEGRVTLVQDRLKPGFQLPRHHHKVMTEIFYVLEGEVSFTFDKAPVIAAPGVTIVIPPFVSHAVTSGKGARLLTVFIPGGFDRYLADIAALTQEETTDPEVMGRLAERYDIWME